MIKNKKWLLKGHFSLLEVSVIIIIFKFEFFISKLLKKWKNSKFYSCSIFCHFWWILRLFRTFGGLYFTIGRSYRQNDVEIRDLHTRNTQKEIKIHKPYMVRFWPPPEPAKNGVFGPFLKWVKRGTICCRKKNLKTL